MSAEVKPIIEFEDLAKLDIRVGTIESIENVEGSRKLMKMQVNFGTFKCQILDGMQGEREDPQEIVGKQALFVVNLAPKKMAGEVSEGMLFNIGYEDVITPVLAQPDKL